MCGIFGYIGCKRDASQTILEGLKTLEYRGYDSWGIAVNYKGKIAVEKHIGKIGDARTYLPETMIGIGHTRWATHGGVTMENAHPHLDCTKEIAVLHNGIVENHQELRDGLLLRGHMFLSQTDTEVIVHLIEEYRKRMTFANAVREAFHSLRGMNAVVAIDSTSSAIIAAKNGSPLAIGIGDGELFLASDITGIVKYTKKVVFMRDGEMAVLGNELHLFDLKDNKKIPIDIQTIDWKIEAVDKGKFEHFMLKEIYEEPTVIRTIAENYDDQILKLSETITKAVGTFFIGSGTASYACLVGTYLFSKIAKKHVNMAAASEFMYLEDFLNKDSLIIALSQSGETIDIVEPLTRAQKKGSTIVGIVNSLGSTIYRMSDQKLLLGAGPEKAVASTKAYVAKLSVLLLLAYAMAGDLAKGKDILLSAASEVDRLLTKESIGRLKKLALNLKDAEHIYVIGRGISYPTSLEAALKVKEVSYIHTEGFAGGELKHGTIALISKGTLCFVFAPKDETYEAIISNATEIRSRGGRIIGVSSVNSSVFDEWIDVREVKDASAIVQIVPIQVLAYHLAVMKGFDPDKPRNLAKSVTVK